MNTEELLSKMFDEQSPEDLVVLLETAITVILSVANTNPNLDDGGLKAAVFAARQIIRGADRELSSIHKDMSLMELFRMLYMEPVIANTNIKTNIMYN
jgi:hypothetical protein